MKAFHNECFLFLSIFGVVQEFRNICIDLCTRIGTKFVGKYVSVPYTKTFFIIFVANTTILS